MSGDREMSIVEAGLEEFLETFEKARGTFWRVLEDNKLIEREKTFKDSFSLQSRKEMSARALKRYPKCVPLIIQFSRYLQSDLIDKKVKFLVEGSRTVAYLIKELRLKVKLSPSKFIYILAGEEKTFPSTGMMLSQLYRECKDEDGFLYISVEEESSFG